MSDAQMDSIRRRMAPLFTANRLDPQPSANTASLGGLRRSIPIYILDVGDDLGLSNKLGAVMMAHGTSLSYEITEWQTWVLSFVCLCFPAFGSIFRDANLSEYTLKPYPEEFIAAVRGVYDDVELDPQQQYLTPTCRPLPAPAALISADYYNCADLDGLYGFLSLVVYLMGKQVSETTRDAIESRRPKNIIDTFSCPEVAFVLTGPGKLGRHAHDYIHKAWSASDHPRKIFIDKFCHYRTDDNRSTRIVFLMFGMLEYSGMQSAAFIHSLLEACPWVIREIPLLAPSFTVYMESIEAFGAADADFRPFLKLYHGNASQIFHSKALQDLNAVACMWLTSTLASMKDYKTVGGEAAKKAFTERLKAKGLNTASLAPETITAPVEVPEMTS